MSRTHAAPHITLLGCRDVQSPPHSLSEELSCPGSILTQAGWPFQETPSLRTYSFDLTVEIVGVVTEPLLRCHPRHWRLSQRENTLQRSVGICASQTPSCLLTGRSRCSSVTPPCMRMLCNTPGCGFTTLT